ncbi:hypothetical protein CLV78_10161 [Aliiruegeria haliotis]|uniref:Uncharacterized protein n=1 Tax=Aliiruegeria haliotis TaxID=1280846 RepID=A0A2T0RXU1_9RHOB|nr:hypothetical protein [Aliiruegeria haliotis]PRY25970.1 hypothetical protein CLV78_10161 [Aliiruegeria haliotis]
MHKTTKVATCCYCGVRAALVLGGDRHNLVCGACGAPLTQLKSLPSEPRAKPASQFGAALPGGDRKKPSKKKKKKKKRSPMQRLFGEIVDEIEDLFD